MAARVYVAFANASGMVDVWAAPVSGGRARRLTAFSRDTYAPTVATDGSVLFKVQSYRTVVAMAPADGGASRPLATFQSETPSWDPAGRSIGITYGTWRRVVDDAHYPDIAQETGIISVDPEHPAADGLERRPRVGVRGPVAVLVAERQMDRVPLPQGSIRRHLVAARVRPGDSVPRRISFLGRGAEAGWPRWSPDGRWLLFDGASRQTHRSAMFVIGMDQETGAITQRGAGDSTSRASTPR